MGIVDMHCDTISRLYQNGEDLGRNSGHIDLEKMRHSGYTLQNFALFINLEQTREPFETVLQMAALFEREMEKGKEWIAPVCSCADIEKNRKAGKVSALLTVEEGGVCQGKLSRLEELYGLGVRMLTLTWNYPNELGYPNMHLRKGEKPDFLTPDMTHGLTETGIAFVEKMEEIGMIPDVSHLSDAGFYDVLKYTRKPFVASHSNARTVCRNVRNMTDDMIRRLAERGGVIGLNFCEDFLTDVSEEERKKENVLEALVQHAKHIINVGGVECLGLGSDFDGIDGNRALPDAAEMEVLAQALKRAGFTPSMLEKVWEENVLRVYREVLR